MAGQELTTNMLFKRVSLEFILMLIIGATTATTMYNTLASDVEKAAEKNKQMEVAITHNTEVAESVLSDVTELKVEIGKIAVQQDNVVKNQDRTFRSLEALIDKIEQLRQRQ